MYTEDLAEIYAGTVIFTIVSVNTNKLCLADSVGNVLLLSLTLLAPTIFSLPLLLRSLSRGGTQWKSPVWCLSCRLKFGNNVIAIISSLYLLFYNYVNFSGFASVLGASTDHSSFVGNRLIHCYVNKHEYRCKHLLCCC